MTPGESICTRMERFQGSHSIPGQKDSRVVILSWDGKQLDSPSVLGYNDSKGVILLRWNDSR